MNATSTVLEKDPKFSREDLAATRAARRSSIKIRGLHHHALRTNNMEATRHFYEDLLGMPMVSALKEMVDPTRGKETPYLHCFFEMGDGSCIAFFEFANGERGEAPKTPQDALDHHLAISVPSFDDIRALMKKFEDESYPIAGIDHGFCYSVYVRDPNDMLVELVFDPENELEINEANARDAHAELERWNRGDFSANNDERDSGTYPMGTYPVDKMMKVLADDRE